MIDAAPYHRGRVECLAALIVTLVVTGLHLVFLFSAGGLWRDESGGVAIATLPHLSEVWCELPHDSFPALFLLLIRGWSAIWGQGDFALRFLGLLVGLGWLGAVWANARWLGLRAPLLCLTLLGFNLTLIQWGDSLRAYGLGCVMIILFFGRMWVFICQPQPRNFIITAILAVLAVQTLYQTAFLVAALCFAGALVLARRSNWALAGVSLLVGAPAAFSLLPYLQPLRASQSWWIVEKAGFNAPFTWHTLSTALDTPIFLGPWLWVGLLLSGIVYGMTWMEKRISRREDVSGDLPFFGACGAVAGLVAFFAFVVSAGLPTQPWYWLILLAFFAACLEATLGFWLCKQSSRLLWIVGGIAALSFVSTVPRIGQRMTSMPEVTAKISAEARSQDLIIVYPWYLGVSFDRYYQGKIPWTTVPNIADHRFHRYDQLKEKLQQVDALRPLFQRIDATLQQGGVVWLVGGLPEPEPGEKGMPSLPAAPDGPTGWYDEPYNHMWGRQLDLWLRQKNRQLQPVFIPDMKRATRYEAIPVYKISPLL